MFQKYRGNVLSAVRTEDVKSVPDFHDPIASLTSWEPLAGGGANFTTHELHQVSPTRYEFRVSPAMKILSWVFIVAGVGITAVGAWKAWHLGIIAKKETLFPAMFGGAFALFGTLFLYCSAIPTIFDREKGYYLKGWKLPERCENPAKLKNFAPLDHIHALQLIVETISGKNGSFPSYELNLVLKDGSRLNVTDHGGLDVIRTDARKLAAFLGKPLWDAI